MRTNWASNLRYRAPELVSPDSVSDACSAVAQASRITALGTRHAFNDIADNPARQISLEKISGVSVDGASQTVKIGAGIAYGRLAPELDRQGWALHNLASLPHISVAGACATGTHGSGLRSGNLSTAVRGMEVITASGELVEFTGDELRGATVGLGALGVVRHLTLALEPSFEMRQRVYQELPLSVLESHLDDVFGSGYSVSLFLDWQDSKAAQMWVKRRAHEEEFPEELFGARAASVNLHPLPGHPAGFCTEQLGVRGAWYERLPHFKMEFTPSSGEELQSEYFVPRHLGYLAICAIEPLRERIGPLLYVSELRTIAADGFWMSPCYQRDSLAIHFTWKPDWEQVRALLPAIEEALEPFAVRPHWAKLFTLDPAALRRRYPKLNAFRDFAARFDPGGKFRNAFLDRYVFSS